jgi:hypothetical protein
MAAEWANYVARAANVGGAKVKPLFTAEAQRLRRDSQSFF